MTTTTVSSGTTTSATITSGNYQYVVSSGIADFTQVDSGGEQYAYSGGTVSATTVYAGGELAVGIDGSASGTTDDGTLYVSGGAIYGTTVGAGGYAVISNGGSASGTTVDSGGTAAVLAGGSISAAVQSGGTLIVAGGADVDVSSVGSGGTVISTGVALFDGSGTVVEPSSVTALTLGGAEDTLYVLSGGSASDLTLSGGSEIQVTAGGSVTSVTVGSSSLVNVYSGATASAITLSDSVDIISGGGAYGTTVYSGGVEYVLDGTATSTTLNFDGEQALYGVDGLAVASNTTVSSGGTELSLYNAVASNTTLAGSGTLDLFNGAASGGIYFTGAGNTLDIVDSDFPEAVLSGFAPGDTIVLSGTLYSSAPTFSVSGPGVVVISAGGSEYDLDIAGVTSNTMLQLTSAGEAFYQLTENAPCFAAGTRILTPQGEIAVERLRTGDAVINRRGEDVPIIWIGRRRLNLERHQRPEQAQPVRIAADAFADGVPARDLVLSPDHALFLDGVLVPAKALINGRNVVQLRRQAVTYYHVELAEHDVIFAEGCAVESYLETGNRGAFENGGGAITLHPDFAQSRREAESCAPFTESGPVLEATAALLLRRHYVTAAQPRQG
jgi:autotransporter passenger strand-loop-strand repeat protein